MKTPVNGQTLRNHLTYSWWKYALIIVLSFMLSRLYFDTSVYQSPPDKRIDLYVYGLGDESALDDYLAGVHSSLVPDQEVLDAMMIMADDAYGPMQLSAYIAAADGDIFFLPRDQFVSMASSGAWKPLEDDAELTSLFTDRGLSLQSGWRRSSDSEESHLYGIPLSRLPGLDRYLYVENGYLCVLVTNGNDENVMKFLRAFCRDMLDPLPEAQPENKTE